MLSLKEYGLAYEPSGSGQAYVCTNLYDDLNLRASKEKKLHNQTSIN